MFVIKMVWNALLTIVGLSIVVCAVVAGAAVAVAVVLAAVAFKVVAAAISFALYVVFFPLFVVGVIVNAVSGDYKAHKKHEAFVHTGVYIPASDQPKKRSRNRHRNGATIHSI